VRIAGDKAEIRTKDFPNKSLECYSFTNLLREHNFDRPPQRTVKTKSFRKTEYITCKHYEGLLSLIGIKRSGVKLTVA
jgi:hypothetical protein